MDIPDLTDVEPNPPPRSSKKITPGGWIMLASNPFHSAAQFFKTSVLALYLRNKLYYTSEEAIAIHHTNIMLQTCLMPLGAFIMTSFLNRYYIILNYVLLLFASRLVLSLAAVPEYRHDYLLYIFFLLDIVGSVCGGGVLSTFCGDQFDLPEQYDALSRFYNYNYFIHNSSVLLAYYLGPVFKTRITCFDEQECYFASFMSSAACTGGQLFMLLIFAKCLEKEKPEKGIIFKFFKCIGNAIKERIRQGRTNPRQHWMDYAEPSYGAKLVGDIKRYFQIITILLSYIAYSAVYEQIDSKWLFQATRLDVRVGSYRIIPDHYQLLNPLMVIIFLPLVTNVIDPRTKRFKTERQIRRVVIGGVLVSIGFIMAGVLESRIRHTTPSLPDKDKSNLRILNSLNCTMVLRASDVITAPLIINPMSSLSLKNIQVETGRTIALSGKGACGNFNNEAVALNAGKATGVRILRGQEKVTTMSYDEIIEKTESAHPTILIFADEAKTSITLKDSKGVSIRMKSRSNGFLYTEIVPETYSLIIDSKTIVENIELHLGGAYVILLASGSFNIYEVIEPNSVHFFWIVPQMIVLTLGEVYFNVTMLSFCYTEAPASLKQVVSATYYFIRGLGEGIIALSTNFSLMHQDYEYYLSGVALLINAAIMAYLATRIESIHKNKKII